MGDQPVLEIHPEIGKLDTQRDCRDPGQVRDDDALSPSGMALPVFLRTQRLRKVVGSAGKLAIFAGQGPTVVQGQADADPVGILGAGKVQDQGFLIKRVDAEVADKGRQGHPHVIQEGDGDPLLGIGLDHSVDDRVMGPGSACDPRGRPACARGPAGVMRPRFFPRFRFSPEGCAHPGVRNV